MVMMKRRWSWTLRKIYSVCVCVCVWGLQLGQINLALLNSTHSPDLDFLPRSLKIRQGKTDKEIFLITVAKGQSA